MWNVRLMEDRPKKQKRNQASWTDMVGNGTEFHNTTVPSSPSQPSALPSSATLSPSVVPTPSSSSAPSFVRPSDLSVLPSSFSSPDSCSCSDSENDSEDDPLTTCEPDWDDEDAVNDWCYRTASRQTRHQVGLCKHQLSPAPFPVPCRPRIVSGASSSSRPSAASVHGSEEVFAQVVNGSSLPAAGSKRTLEIQPRKGLASQRRKKRRAKSKATKAR